MRAQTVKDYINLKNIDEVVISPSEKFIAAIISDNFRKYQKKKEKTVLVIYDLSLNIIEKIEGNGIHSVSFSSDDRLLYVEEDTINIVSVNSKNRFSVKFSGEVQKAKWHSGDILFTGHGKKKEKEDDAYFFEESDFYDDLYLLSFSEGIKRITHDIQIWEFDTNGEKIIAVTSNMPQESSWYRARLSSIDLSGLTKTIYDPDFRQIGKIKISKDGDIAFIESLMSDRGVISGDVIFKQKGKNTTKNLTENDEASYSHIQFSDVSKNSNEQEMLVLKNEKTTFSIVNLIANEKLWEGTGIVYPAFSPSFSYNKGKIAFSFSDLHSPPEIYLVNKKINKTAINSSLNDIESYPSELVEWESTDGKRIYGLLRVRNPEDPLIVYIHGGPTSFSYSSFIDRISIFMGNRFSVFMPNYRGSVGMGRKYAESNRGDLGGKDFDDIIKGIKFIRNMGKIKTDRIYITGGSYGGYMSALAIMKSDMFKASVSLFGISDWMSFHGESNLYDWDRIHFDADPYKFDKYDEYSPIRIVHDVKTPILLMHGINDPYVPIGQYYAFYRFLKEKGKEVRLIVFPREGHGFREKEHIRRQYKDTIAFFNMHK